MPALDLGTLHAKQARAFRTEATELLFGGAAGPGKSHFLRISAIAWAVEIPGLQQYLFRRTYSDLYDNHMTGESGFPALLAPWINAKLVQINYSDNDIRFANGSVIHLRHAQHAKDVYNYQGAEMHRLMIDELTQWPEDMYRYLRSRVRLGGFQVPKQYAHLFPRVDAGANPGGIGHTWVKANWIDYAEPYELKQAPRSGGGMMRQYIPARLEDNPTMTHNDPHYAERLEGLYDPALVRAMRQGDWDIVAGGMFDDVWSRDVHVLEPFTIPRSWYVDRAFDWGSTRPFSVGWWAESDGSEVELADGTKHAFPRGTLIRIAEWYGWNGTPNEGIRATAKDIARGIRDREKALKDRVEARIHPGPADSSIFNTENGHSIAADMETAGIRWLEANKKPGTRKQGWDRIRGMLRAAMHQPMEDPGLFVFSTCSQFIRTLPVLPRSERDPEDADTDAEDHIADETRYRVLALKPVARRVKVKGV